MVSKVVLTGGPCAGKTTCLTYLVEKMGEAGIKVIVIPEIATIAIGTTGLNPDDNIVEFQRAVLKMQLAMEKTVEDYVRCSGFAENACIICDRGAMDFKAYVTPDVLADVLKSENKSETELLNQYDKVIHLVSTAVDLPTAYTLSNNQARRESVSEASDLDYSTRNAWLGHNEYTIIDNTTDFERKKARVLSEVMDIHTKCGSVEGSSNKVKVFVDRDQALSILKQNYYTEVSMVQFYLKSNTDPNVLEKIRFNSLNGFTSYTYNIKYKDAKKSYTYPISAEEFNNKLLTIDTDCVPIKKTRCYANVDTVSYYIDFFEQLDFAIVEVNEQSKDKMLHLFEEIQINEQNMKEIDNFYIAKQLEVLKNAEISRGEKSWR